MTKPEKGTGEDASRNLRESAKSGEERMCEVQVEEAFRPCSVKLE